MRSTLSIGICLLATGAAFAGPIQGTVSGFFPTGDSTGLPDGGALLRLGTPESRLVFTSAGTFNVTPGQTFFLGSFRFENESLGDANAAEAFQVVFGFSNLEGIGGARFSYDLSLEQDPRNLIETITLGTSSDGTFRSPTGEEYTLVLGLGDTLGFDTVPHLDDSFESEFCIDGSAYLYGTFVPVGDAGPQVPEPSSLVLIGIGVGLAAVRRRAGRSGATHRLT
jgi:hypothetical protein